MNKMTRQQQYRAASPELQELYASSDVGAAQRRIFDAFGLEESLYKEYVHIFGDIILGLARPEEIQTLVANRLPTQEPITSHIAEETRRILFPLLPGYQKKTPQLEQAAAPQVPTEVQTPVVGYANVPRPAAGRPSAPPVVPTYRKPLTDTPRYDDRAGGDTQSAR